MKVQTIKSLQKHNFKYLPKAVYKIDRSAVYYTYNIKGEVVLMVDHGHRAFGQEQLFVIDGISKVIFEHIDGKTPTDRVLQKVFKLKKLPISHKKKFENQAQKFIKHLLSNHILTYK